MHNERNQPSVWVVILNYNGWQDTEECVRSVLCNNYENLHLVVVENGSTDESPTKLAHWDGAETVKLLESCRNLGIAGGNNLGIRYALDRGAAAIITLSNDTVVACDFVEKLMETAEHDKDTGAVGAKILYYDEPDYIWFCGARINPWLARAPYIYAGSPDSGDLPSVLDVDALMGCVMLLKRQTVEKEGYFDERYFFQNEDLEYSYRLRRAGWKIKVDTRTWVKHKIGRTVPTESYARWYYATRNRLLFIRENLTTAQRATALAFFIATRPAKFAHWARKGRWDLVAATWRGFRDYRRQAWGGLDKC